MPSEYYYKSIEIGKKFQLENSSWGGDDCKNYHNQICLLMSKYGSETVLDYGCGKGRQYQNLVPYGLPNDMITEPMTFQTRINAKEVYKFDPCVEEFNKEPVGQQFDAVICTQVLNSIPDADMKWFAKHLSSYATKFLFIGLHNPYKNVKSKKLMYDNQYVTYPRSVEWYLEQFSSIKHINVYWWFRDHETPANHWYLDLLSQSK